MTEEQESSSMDSSRRRNDRRAMASKIRDGSAETPRIERDDVKMLTKVRRCKELYRAGLIRLVSSGESTALGELVLAKFTKMYAVLAEKNFFL